MATTAKPNLLDNDAAAEFLGLRPNTLPIWRCTRRYNLPYHKVGRRVFYDEVDLLAFLDSRKVATGGRG